MSDAQPFTREQSTSIAALRALHSYWSDTLLMQPDDVIELILGAVGGAQFKLFERAVLDADGPLRLVRVPAGLDDPGADMYVLSFRRFPEGERPLTRVLAANLGLVGAILNVEVELDDDGLQAWLDEGGDR